MNTFDQAMTVKIYRSTAYVPLKYILRWVSFDFFFFSDDFSYFSTQDGDAKSSKANKLAPNFNIELRELNLCCFFLYNMI